MDKKYLDKVLGQIVRETRMDYDEGRLYTPFSPFLSPPLSLPSFFTIFLSLHFLPFSQHCKEVYGLNRKEIEYVWNEYRKIIKDKIENNG